MGIFWNYTAQPPASTTQLFRAALQAPPPARADLESQARDLAAQATPQPQVHTANLNVMNLIVAILIVFAFVGAGIGTNAAGLTTSTASLFALATTAFGIVVGLLGGEKPATPSKPTGTPVSSSAPTTPASTDGSAPPTKTPA